MEPTQLCQPDVGHNLCAQLAAVCHARADAPAIVFPEYGEDGVISYSRLLDLIGRAAGLLQQQGLRPGDRVILCLDNQPELIVLVFACASLGMPAVVVNNRLKQPELELLLTDSRARCVVTSPVYAEVWGDLLERAEHAIVIQRDPFAAQTTSAACVPVRDVDPAFVFYTSGTTAVPKGVVITHAHARWAAAQNIAHLGVGPDDVTLLLAPLHHVLAFSFQMLTTLFSGGCIVLRTTFNPARFWGEAIKQRCTWAGMLPYFHHALEAFPKPESHSFKFWGFPCKYRYMETLFGVDSVGWWGMTELFAIGSVSARNAPEAPELSVGTPSGYDYRLVDTREDAGPFAAAINGELQIRGERGKTIFLEYLGKPEETELAFTADGWFITGDRLFQDSRQALFFDVRVKDIIRVGGENVSAAELEHTVRGTGVVQDVAVVAGPHRMFGEVPIVCAILNQHGARDRAHAEAEILRTCRERLAEFKQPHAVRFFEEFPRAELGKVVKSRLRELLAGPGPG
jgi:crotonobetaine/carnitine-CoA ligase